MLGLFKKNKVSAPSSLNKIALNKFKKNKTGIFSVYFVIFSLLLAILGYLIVPDNTPYANQQILEISLSKPLSKHQFIKITQNKSPQKVSFLKRIISGKPENHNFIPITDYKIIGDSIYYSVYKMEAPYDKFSVHVADVLFDIKEIKSTNKDFFEVITTEGELIQMTNSEASERIQKKHILTKRYILGTDRYGRDVLSQLIIGSRVSLSVGFISVSIALLLGIFLGAIAGYYRGLTDELIMWFINVIWSVPSLLLVIAISFALGKGFWQVFIAIGLTMWVDIARVVRGQVMSLREKEFVEAGKALGFSNFRIIFKHILPNVTGTVAVIAASNFASAILIESGLSFLGLGVQPPMPSWGTMIKENYGFIILDYGYLAIIPGIAIMLMVLAFMLIGNALRDALDIKEA